VLTPDRSFSIWPFEGSLATLLTRQSTILPEVNPAIAYTAALREKLPATVLRIAKTKRPVREKALAMLRESHWVARQDVWLSDLDAELNSEDDFDAADDGAALLRCTLEGSALDSPELDDSLCEGGILLASLADLRSKWQQLRVHLDEV